MSDDPFDSEEHGPQFDSPKHPGPIFRYLIFSQQRSGSSWLSRRLINFGIFGVPAEYLNPLVSIRFAQRINCPTNVHDDTVSVKFYTYLGAVEDIRTSPTGRFGIKVQPNQIFPLFNDDLGSVATFLKGYDALIVLTCRDKLRQAISGAIADLTGHWRSDGKDPDLSGVHMLQLMTDTATKLARYITEDQQMAAVSQASRRPVLYLTYEQMVADPEGTLERVARILGYHGPLSTIPDTNAIKVPAPRPGRANAEVRRLFLRYIEGLGRG
jgi:LPS sulfotransferase NodH